MPKRVIDLAGMEAPAESQSTNARKLFGIALIIGGAIVLFSNLGLFSFLHMWDISWSLVFPILLILLGMAIIYYRQAERAPAAEQPADSQAEQPADFKAEPPPPAAPYRTFRRSRTDKKLGGVCGGLARYFSIDSTLFRLLYIILCLASFGAGIVLYITLVLLVPYESHPNL
jgi:phage shock protein C